MPGPSNHAPTLKGKVGIIIGASRGIGAAAAELMCAMGAKLMLASRDGDALRTLANTIRSSGGEADFVIADAMDLDSIGAAIDATATRFGPITIAVNNAGIAHTRTDFHELPLEVLDLNIMLNMRSLMYAMQRQVTEMVAAGGGSIVNVGSATSIVGMGRLAAYSASKHGALGLTRSVAIEYAPHNVRVNMVAPGGVLTQMFLNGTGKTPGGVEGVKRATPLGRIAAPSEVAHPIAWLASDASSYVTGVVLPVDGGMTLSAA